VIAVHEKTLPRTTRNSDVRSGGSQTVNRALDSIKSFAAEDVNSKCVSGVMIGPDGFAV
jgi:hypothetical protein